MRRPSLVSFTKGGRVGGGWLLIDHIVLCCIFVSWRVLHVCIICRPVGLFKCIGGFISLDLVVYSWVAKKVWTSVSGGSTRSSYDKLVSIT